jgi:uncharacterized phiE125 gp8 family phage protein
MGLMRITSPDHLPVTVAQAKAHMNVENDLDDALIEGFIEAAAEMAENLTRRQLVTSQWDYTAPAFPRCGPLELPRPPLQSVDAVFYIDPDGQEQQLSCGAYSVDTYALVAAIRPVPGTSWPSTQPGPNAVRVRYTCGWPMDDAASPPAWTGPKSIATWILVRVATMYEQREAIVTGQTVAELPRNHVDGLLDAHVIPLVA